MYNLSYAIHGSTLSERVIELKEPDLLDKDASFCAF